MGTIELIIKISILVVNTLAVSFISIIVSKWHRRMENKLDEIKTHISHVTKRNDIVYINQLGDLKRSLIEQERYEEAKKIDECIKKEYKNLGIK